MAQLVTGQAAHALVDAQALVAAVSARGRGLLFRQARAAVEAVDDTHRPAVLDAAAQLLASWWTVAAGYGVSSQLVPGLPVIALDALVAVDDDRRGVEL